MLKRTYHLNKAYLHLVSLTTTILSFGQNLVPNSSFEDIVSCPTTENQIYLAEPWFSPYLCMGGTFESCSSSDVFNECFIPPATSLNVDVPNNSLGIQYARTGVGYAGIGFWSKNEWREKIEVQLLDTLNAGKIYCVKMFVVNKRPFIDSIISITSTANLHIYLSKEMLIDYPNAFNYLTPTIKNPDDVIIDDTTNWTEISGCYLAQGGEKYLTIGSFYNNANSYVSDPSSEWAYYLIDDVSVEEYDGANCDCPQYDSLFPTPVEHSYTLPNVFTPNRDQINDIWSTNFIDDTEYVIILNRWGNEIVRLDIERSEWDGGTFDGTACREGVYFYKAYLRGELKNGFIHLVR